MGPVFNPGAGAQRAAQGAYLAHHYRNRGVGGGPRGPGGCLAKLIGFVIWLFFMALCAGGVLFILVKVFGLFGGR